MFYFFFQDHNPTKELNHVNLWKEACLEIKNKMWGKSNGDSRTSIPTKFEVTQADLDDIDGFWYDVIVKL